ncbi:MAG: NAD(P)H-dependent oxidoreductase [Verrucomicrobiota bacterium]
MNVLVILAHPDIDSSRSNRHLLLELEKHPNLSVNSIYKNYSDWKIDVTREQELLAKHDRIVFQFPLYWYSTPPLLKKWQDDVLTYGWAYGDGGDQLKGKELLIATSIGGHPDVYRAGGRNQFTLSEILRPLQATANICGMRYLPAFVVGGHLDEAGLTTRAKEYIEYISDPKPRGIAS